MKRNSSVLIAIAVLALAACSGNAGSSGHIASAGASEAPAAAATNPTDFPLIEGATILATKSFSQTVDASKIKTGGAAFSQGSGTYAGEQVIAKSDKSLEDLAIWLAAQTKTPPAGYTALSASGAQVDQAHATAKKYGIDFAAFQNVENGKKHGVLLIAMDPAVLDAKLGPAIGMIQKYASLPDMFKGPVDAQLKSRFGMSGSELLDPGSPLGAALAAYSEVKSTDSRAIVVVDAAKQ
ncbi:MAG: hypothetical protein M3R30_05995 [Candidatus Eremiobacteraeota bacterium]|nr:hypothetical protein [Candidatus Eremiobacteraeota bacterium]